MGDYAWLAQPAPLIVLCGLLGLIVGSFLNVVILRLPARLEHGWRQQAHEFLGTVPTAEAAPPDLVVTASHCPHCKHRLAAWDNIPLLGWLLLRGRCRYCKAPISIQYPLVELLTGVASAVIAWQLGFGWPLLAGLVFTWILIAASGIDFRTQLLPDQLTLPLLWLGLLLNTQGAFTSLTSAVIGAVAGYLSLWSLYWAYKLIRGREGMGHGDFKLLAALGAWIGLQGILPTILLSSLVGAIVGSIWLAAKGRDRATPIPFGPYLAIAGWIVFMWGEQIIGAYRHYAGI